VICIVFLCLFFGLGLYTEMVRESGMFFERCNRSLQSIRVSFHNGKLVPYSPPRPGMLPSFYDVHHCFVMFSNDFSEKR
jgi:hypothetical protein